MDYDKSYFDRKTAIVTGSASGIGLALVEELLKSNTTKVVLSDINKEKLKEQEKRLRIEYGERVKSIICDVTKEEEVQRLIKQSADFFGGRIDLLINNAGSLFAGWFEDLSDNEWKKAFDVNFYSAMYGMRAVIPIMKEQGGGQIINMISGSAFMPMAQWSSYVSTKAALNALTIALRTEYWDDKIKISSAAPGTTKTAIWKDFELPESAQTVEQAAIRILHGITKNDRIIFGSDADVKGAAKCFSYRAQKGRDKYLLRVARERHKGINAI